MTAAGDRDDRGRFAAGNPGGPKGPRRRASDLRRAAEEAISPDHVQALMRKATRMGLEGNLSAARLVLDRACGRAAEAAPEPEPLPFTLPRLRTAEDCGKALERLVQGICHGTIEREVAQTLISAVQARLKSIETVEFEKRIEGLELAAKQAEERVAPDPRFE